MRASDSFYEAERQSPGSSSRRRSRGLQLRPDFPYGVWRKDAGAGENYGSVAIVTAGTSDAFVSHEAGRTLEYLGVRHEYFEDCGVAGLWRLEKRLPEINRHSVVIVCAGLDAAIASVLGGLTGKPLIAVPTSVGYGAARGGETALHSTLCSCAPGVTVMNIDNGYGAACAAVRILNSRA
ncbi:MAG: nickel pincer cofactor biosynthesis protein LarB [Dakarella massiliensis]